MTWLSTWNRKTARRIYLTVHRWLGLGIGAVLAILGLTGSLLVFEHNIDEWLNPKLLIASPGVPRVSVQEIIELAEQSFSGTAVSLVKLRVGQGVWAVWFQSGTETSMKFTQVLVDPVTAQVTGQRVWGEHLTSWIYRLHFRLLGGDAGATVVGLAGIATVVSILTGFFLWWPLWKHSWRAAFYLRPGKRLYDLHKILGVAGGIVLLMVAFTGVTMEFPNAIRGMLAQVSSITEEPENLGSQPSEAASMLTADQAITIAQGHFPGAEFDHLHPPVDDSGFYEVAFRQSGEIQESFGRSQVFLDPYSGELLAMRRPQDFSAADTFLAWQFPLHNGEALGLVGRWIIFASGLLPAVLFVTGGMLWWRRRHRTKRPPPPIRQSEATGEASCDAEVATA